MKIRKLNGGIGMDKIILIIGLLIFITGCGAIDRASTTFTGNATKVCVDGVEYLQFTSGASVAYTMEGKIKTCGKENR
jgi:hypothetical protein